MNVAKRMDLLGSETAFAVSAEAAKLAQTGTKIYPFHLGDINLPTPISVVSGAKEAIRSGKTGYCPAPGIPELREALAIDVGNSRGINYNIENVSIQPGGKPSIGKYVAAMMEKGDVVLYPNPGYPIYESQIEFYGGIAHPYGYLDNPSGLELDFEAIEKGIRKGAKHIFYNNYNNPTGASSSNTEMERLANLVIQNDMFLISDDAYFDTLFEGTPRSIASLPGMKERTLTMYTFSKKFAMTGWRLGGAIGPSKIIEQITRLNVNMESCTTHFIQYAGIAGLRAPKKETQDILDKLRIRRDIMVETMNSIEGVEAHSPEAGFYVFPKITNLMKRIGFEDVEEFRKTVLRDTGVSFCGRHHFGRPLENESDSYIRLAFSGIGKDDLKEGMNLFQNWIDSRTK
ncbi:MAG: aminotransferase class I/II-fold pyridoxal phosphate-dependent enzyme [Candidatus Poseidoniia archaeon]|jgi:aspartate/methionine/tyrosine aminotransferase|nr:aminotransferase class I/II-fold pyridoxal phosphate-dependent enzyme [Candidatus Poseidoniia archaeon]|tara:strand:- start:359 stop:1561 length:1203 start_codon:yes stop_codon:yes gene_type:complete